MEYGIIIGLGILGTYINNNNNNNTNNNTNNNNNTSKNIKNIISNDQDNIYNSKIIKNISNNIQNKAIDRKSKSNEPSKTNVIPPNYNNLKNFNIVDKSNELVMGTITGSELLKYDNNEESYTTQFDPLTFDNDDEPVTKNESYKTDRNKMLNIERSLTFNQNYSPFDQETDMTYGIVDKEHFTHNNMQPFTSQRDKILDDINNNKNEVLIDRYTGSSRYYFQKKEIEPFFEPEITKNTSFVNGAPNVTNEQRNRYIPSLTKQNERPFEPVQVTPGLNLKHDEKGTQGFFDQFRPHIKTTNELRPHDKPKLSYTQPILEGKKGEKRSVTAPFIKRKPETTKEVPLSEYVPTGSIVKTQKSQENFDIKDNSRMVSNELYGPLSYFNKSITNTETVGKFNDPLSKSVLFEERGNMMLSNKFNPNEKSYNILDNQRRTTNNENMKVGNKFYNSNTVAIDYSDIAKDTIKQTLLYENQGNMTNNNKNGIAFSNDYDMKTTIRQIDNKPLNTNLSYLNNNIGYTNLTDNAKQTIKEITSNNQFNDYNIKNNTTGYSNLFDKPRNTIKESFIEVEYNKILNPSFNNIYSNITDIAKSTIKETTTESQFNTNVQSQQQAIYNQNNDKAKSTIKETTSKSQLNTNVQSQQQAIYNQNNDKAKSTIKETTVINEYNKNTNSMMKSNYTNLTDEAKMTNKQTLTNSQFNTVLGSRQENITTPYNDQAKTTIKQTINNIPINLNLDARQNVGYSNLNDMAKNTIKENYSNIQFNSNMMNNNGLYINNQDLPKQTIKETTQQQFNTILGNIATSYSNLNDQAKLTIKQVITELNGSSRPNIGGINMANISNLSDQAKLTLKQILTLQEFNNNLKSHNGGIYSNFNDIAKPTEKEILSMIENNLNLQSNHLTHTTHLQDKPKNSLKEINILQNQNTYVNTSQYQTQPYFDHNDLMKPTIKQNVYPEINIATFKNPQSYLKDYNDIANPTIRQTNGNTNHINPANKNIETIINNAHIDPTQREFITIKNYLSGMSGPNEIINDSDVRNMNQNISKELIAQGRTPNQLGPTVITNKSMINVDLKTIPSHSRMEVGGFNGHSLYLDNRDYWKSSDLKNMAYVDDRLTNKLISALETNPLINNGHRNIINKKNDDNTNIMLNNLSGKSLIDAI